MGWGEKEKGPTMMIALELLSWQLCHYIDLSQHHYYNGREQHSKNYYSHYINLECHPSITNIGLIFYERKTDMAKEKNFPIVLFFSMNLTFNDWQKTAHSGEKWTLKEVRFQIAR